MYIPLGGNRKGLKRQILNLFIVELLTGIWHGANWNFICWGLYYFVLLAIEKLFLLPHLKKGKVWPHIYTLFLVVVGWAMFVGNDTGVSFGLLFQKLFIPSGGVSPLYFLRRLADGGNTVVVIEHNLDVIKTADYIIDMGPEGGDRGGTVIAQGTPEEIVKVKKSYTGYYVKKMLEKELR